MVQKRWKKTHGYVPHKLLLRSPSLLLFLPFSRFLLFSDFLPVHCSCVSSILRSPTYPTFDLFRNQWEAYVSRLLRSYWDQRLYPFFHSPFLGWFFIVSEEINSSDDWYKDYYWTSIVLSISSFCDLNVCLLNPEFGSQGSDESHTLELTKGTMRVPS